MEMYLNCIRFKINKRFLGNFENYVVKIYIISDYIT